MDADHPITGVNFACRSTEGLEHVSAGLAALRPAAEKDRGRAGVGEGADWDDMQERLGQVLERGVGMREGERKERDEAAIRDRRAGAKRETRIPKSNLQTLIMNEGPAEGRSNL